MEWVDGNLGSQGDDEVSGDLADRRRRARRGPVGRVRRQGSASGRRRQDGARRARHDGRHHLQVHLEGRWPRRLSRAGARSPKGATGAKSKVDCDALILDDESRSTRIRTSRWTRRRRPRARGDSLEDRRGAALLPDEPRPHGGRGERDDRLRLHRADHEGAAAGVRGRDEPADPAPDGRQSLIKPLSAISDVRSTSRTMSVIVEHAFRLRSGHGLERSSRLLP